MFDSLTTISPNEMKAADKAAKKAAKIAFFKKRREDAVALWATIPPDQVDMCNWQTCALGWLARKKHDGWRMSYNFPVWNIDASCPSAEDYFGLQDGHSIKIFLNREFDFWTNIFSICGDLIYYFFNINFEAPSISAAKVSKALLAAPYNV